MLEIRTLSGLIRFTAYAAAVQERDGSIVDALETVEQAISANPNELAYPTETLRLRREVALQQRQLEQAAAGFQGAIDLARGMGAKV